MTYFHKFPVLNTTSKLMMYEALHIT